MNLYLKIILGDWENASRDKRELRVAMELGYDIVVIASTKKNNKIFKDKVEEFDVIRIPTRSFGEGKIKKYLGYIWGYILFIREARKLDAKIISGHNYDALSVGYLSQVGKKNKAKLIYDSHEFELERKKRSWLGIRLLKMIEGFLLKRTDINMMVTDTIADDVQRIYSLQKRPLVIRNIPERAEICEEVIERNRLELCKHLNIKENGTVIMIHGGIAPGRGIEEAIQATEKLQNVGLIVMGYALDDVYKHKLVELANEKKINDRVYFKEAVPFVDLYGYVAAADIGLVLIQNKSKSYFYSLPNKLFENIQAMTPVIGSDFPGIGGIIDKYEIGIKIKPDSVDDLVNAIEIMRLNPKKYSQFKMNEKKAREELCWQKESRKLAKAIENI